MKTSKQFRLFKRDDDGKEMDPSAEGYRDRFYYFRFTYLGKAYPRCLETNDATEAQKRAKAKYTEIIAAVSAGEYRRLDKTKLRAERSATLEQLFAAYRVGPSEASADTRTLNINALKQMVSSLAPNGGEGRGEGARIRELTPTLARRWFETITVKILEEKDQEIAASLKRSANSRWAQARSLFTDRCLAHYQDLELITRIEDLADFVRAGNSATFNRIPKQNYNPPSEEIIRTTLTQWEAIEDRDVFLAIGHELAFGLRLAEFAQAKWSWHTSRNGYPILDGRAAVKNGSGLVQVRALDPFYTTMKHRAIIKGWWPDRETEDLIIPGTATYRTDGLFRAVSDWLRQLGWETMKTNHALRAYAGSQVAMRYGIYEAQMFLRHSTVKVTEQSYSHFVSKFKPSDLDSIPARWALLPANLTSMTSAPKDDTLDVSKDLRKIPLDSSRVSGQSLEIPHREN